MTESAPKPERKPGSARFATYYKVQWYDASPASAGLTSNNRSSEPRRTARGRLAARPSLPGHGSNRLKGGSLSRKGRQKGLK